jgi:hypothetical protein
VRIVLVALTCLAATTSAQGMEVYCRSDGFARMENGVESRLSWFVVNSKARRAWPGEPRPRPGCGDSRASVGPMYRPPEMIQRPRLGRAAVVSNYRVYYESARAGKDTMTIRLHWLHPTTGKQQSAIVHYDIHVSDRSL